MVVNKDKYKNVKKDRDNVPKNAYYEDNKGGDVFQMIDNSDGSYTFKVGYCCVYILELTGTISQLCKKIAEMNFALPANVSLFEDLRNKK